MNYCPVSPLKVWWGLLVWFQMTKTVENVSNTKQVCEGRTLEAYCSFGNVIDFIYANYGRTSPYPCNYYNLTGDVDCNSPGSIDILKQRCVNKRSCKVPATTSVFGDPCNGTEKYLEVVFQCKPGNPFLLIGDPDKGIQAIDIETSEDYLFEGEIKNIKEITAFDFDYRNRKIVYIDNRTHWIHRAPMEYRVVNTLASISFIEPMGLALDWIHDKLYLTDNGKKAISVTDLNGMWEKTLFETDHKQLGSIVVDPIEGWMFWTDWGDEPKIERAGMDGSHRSAIIYTDIERPFSIALNLSSHKIFWMDPLRGQIFSANYDGTERATLFSSDDFRGATSLNLFKGYMYWIHQEKIYEMKVGALFSRQILNGREWRNIENFKIFHDSQQPAGPIICGGYNGGCPYLCLPTPKLHGISRPGSKPYRCTCSNHNVDCLDDPFDEISSSSQVVSSIMTKLLALTAVVVLFGY